MLPENTVALVTGGARRVGRAIVLELARSGCDVVVHHNRSADEAKSLVREVQGLGRRATAISGDLADRNSWQGIVRQAVDWCGRLDILVNNAAAFLTDGSDTIDAFDPERWETVLRTNLLAPAGLCHHARGHLAAHGNGRIVNLCDASTDRPWPSHLAYSVSKAALVAMTKALARALAPQIRVNGVAPGIVQFPDDYDAETRARLIRRVPLGRSGTPEDVAVLVRFLAEEGNYLTGQIIAVDGGRSLA